MTRIDFFNIPNRLRDPDYTMAVMVPPRSDGPDGQNLVGKFNMDPTGYVVCNTGKPEQIAKSIKLVDWMYSDEATELFSWGKENESYIVEDGKRKFLLDEGETATQRFGMTTYGLYQRIDPNSKATAYSEELVKMLELAHGNMEKQVNPVLWLALNPDEQREVDIIMDSVKSYTEEGLSKFLLGQESMSLWDSFQSKLREMGVDRLVEIYDSAYKRAIK